MSEGVFERANLRDGAEGSLAHQAPGRVLHVGSVHR